MQHNQETIEIFNDLIMINNDRIAGYERAIKELGDGDKDLIPLFENMIDESRQARMALGKEVQVLGGTMVESTMQSGKIYVAWLDFKALFSGHDRHAVIANCEAVEDATQKAYTSALEEEQIPSFLQDLIMEQQQSLKYSHDEIKSFRDQTA